jgi:hypothetical protein
MYVDPRVAHGRAKFDLDRNPRLLPEERVAEVYALLRLFAANYAHQGPSPREMRRYLARNTPSPDFVPTGLSPGLANAGLHGDRTRDDATQAWSREAMPRRPGEKSDFRLKEGSAVESLQMTEWCG